LDSSIRVAGHSVGLLADRLVAAITDIPLPPGAE